MHIAPPTELICVVSSSLFAWWGIDLLGPFPKAVEKIKYLVVAIDYSTKWIEVEPLAKITAKNVLRFFKRNILARFRVLTLVISDNGNQFTDQKFQYYLRNIGIKQSFSFLSLSLFSSHCFLFSLVPQEHLVFFPKPRLWRI